MSKNKKLIKMEVEKLVKKYNEAVSSGQFDMLTGAGGVHLWRMRGKQHGARWVAKIF